MTFALLFPGQGTQYPDMLRWLDDRPEAATVLDLLKSELGPDWRGRLVDHTWSTSNAVAQPLLVGVALAAWRCIGPMLTRPKLVAGYSVGELPAFCVAGVFDEHTAISLAGNRARLMDASTQAIRTGLLALHGASARDVETLCDAHGLAVSIDVSDNSLILGGPVSALEAAEHDSAMTGIGTTRLAVNVASHTWWMHDATNPFAEIVARTPMSVPHCPVVSNLTGVAVDDPAELHRCLVQQIANTVQWRSCMDTLAERGVHCALEIGPGASLSKLLRSRHPHIEARSIDEFRSPEACARWVAARAPV